MRIFGSVARGESDSESDVDFLVKLEPGTTLLKYATLLRKLELLLGFKVDAEALGTTLLGSAGRHHAIPDHHTRKIKILASGLCAIYDDF